MTGRGKALLALAVVVSTAVALWLTNRAVTPKECTWNDVVAEARKGGYRLVTTDELWERYQKGSKDLLLVDTRQEWEYRTGHIDGAVNFPMDGKERADLRLMDYLPPEQFVNRMTALKKSES